MAAVTQNGEALRHAWAVTRRDREVVLAAVNQCGRALRHAPAGIRGEQDILLAAVRREGHALQLAAAAMRADRTVVLAAVGETGSALRLAAAELRADKQVVLTAVVADGQALQHASPELQADPEVVEAAVRKDGTALDHAPAELRADEQIVLAAVATSGEALRYAAPSLRNSDRVVAAAVAASPDAIRHAGPEAHLTVGGRSVRIGDVLPRPTVPLAESVSGAARRELLTELERHKAAALAAGRLAAAAAAKQQIIELRRPAQAEWEGLWARQAEVHTASSEPGLMRRVGGSPAAAVAAARQDEVLTAVSQDGGALRHAAAELQSDTEVVRQNGAALRHAPGLKADAEIVLAAVEQDGTSLMFAGPGLRADPEVVLAAVGQNGGAARCSWAAGPPGGGGGGGRGRLEGTAARLGRAACGHGGGLGGGGREHGGAAVGASGVDCGTRWCRFRKGGGASRGAGRGPGAAADSADRAGGVRADSAGWWSEGQRESRLQEIERVIACLLFSHWRLRTPHATRTIAQPCTSGTASSAVPAPTPAFTAPAGSGVHVWSNPGCMTSKFNATSASPLAVGRYAIDSLATLCPCPSMTAHSVAVSGACGSSKTFATAAPPVTLTACGLSSHFAPTNEENIPP